MKTALVGLLLSVAIGGLAQQAFQDADQVATLTVRLDGFKHEQGTAMVALTNAQGFLASRGAVRAQSTTIRDGLAICVFKDVPYGKYAVQAYHDENNNKKLDTGLFGIPREPYGFSNDARGSFGPPKYEEAEFSLAAPMVTINIHVK